jgi:hypothetical protein
LLVLPDGDDFRRVEAVASGQLHLPELLVDSTATPFAIRA